MHPHTHTHVCHARCVEAPPPSGEGGRQSVALIHLRRCTCGSVGPPACRMSVCCVLLCKYLKMLLQAGDDGVDFFSRTGRFDGQCTRTHCEENTHRHTAPLPGFLSHQTQVDSALPFNQAQCRGSFNPECDLLPSRQDPLLNAIWHACAVRSLLTHHLCLRHHVYAVSCRHRPPLPLRLLGWCGGSSGVTKPCLVQNLPGTGHQGPDQGLCQQR